MENEKPKKLYPLHFEPVVEEMPWGTQTWALADLGFVNSEIKDGWLAGNSMEDLIETYIDRAVGEAAYQYYGRQFPVAVRYLDVKGETPLQVHPDDEEAMQRYDALGKAELIYILEADASARLYLGFNREMSAQEFYTRCNDGTIMETLNEIVPVKGEAYMVKPGLVNALKGHLKAIVVQESSDVNLILFDKNQSAEDEEVRQLHLAEAIDLVDYQPYNASVAAGDGKAAEGATEGAGEGAAGETKGKTPTDKSTELLVARPEFTVSKIKLADPLQMSLEHLGCFLIYCCAKGAASIQIPTVNEKNEKCMENYEFKEGETVLVPAEISGFFLVPRDRDTVLLETMVESHEEVDSYIDPNTEPFLEGEDYEGLEDGEFDEEEDECGCGCHDDDCDCGHDHHDGHGCSCGHGSSAKPQN